MVTPFAADQTAAMAIAVVTRALAPVVLGLVAALAIAAAAAWPALVVSAVLASLAAAIVTVTAAADAVFVAATVAAAVAAALSALCWLSSSFSQEILLRRQSCHFGSPPHHLCPFVRTTEGLLWSALELAETVDTSHLAKLCLIKNLVEPQAQQ